MNTSLLLFTSYELVLALLFGLLTIYISIKVINRLILNKNFLELILKESNSSVAIFEGCLVFCIMLLVENSILPSVDALQTMVLSKNEFTFEMLYISFGYFLAFYLISLVFASILMAISFHVFIRATVKVDELAEMKKKNNIAVAVLISVVLVSMTLFIMPAFENFIASLVNYNSLSNYTGGGFN